MRMRGRRDVHGTKIKMFRNITMIRNLDKVLMVRNGEFLAFGIMNTIVG